MKYLKKFEKIQETSLIEDLEDIFQELKDSYFELRINNISHRNLNFNFNIIKDEEGGLACEFHLKEIHEVILHMISYLKLNSFKLISITSFNLNGNVEIDLNFDNWDIKFLNKKILSITFWFE